jgi:hypothetical protein
MCAAEFYALLICASEGVADEPTGGDRQRLQLVYFAQFPDGPSRLGWAGLIYVRVRPTWLRHSDFRRDPPKIVEVDARGWRVCVGRCLS